MIELLLQLKSKTLMANFESRRQIFCRSFSIASWFLEIMLYIWFDQILHEKLGYAYFT